MMKHETDSCLSVTNVIHPTCPEIFAVLN